MKTILCILCFLAICGCTSGGSVKKVGHSVIICDSNNECRVDRIEKEGN